MKIGMAARLLKAYERGNKELCTKSDEPKLVEAYCNKNFADDPT
jgi:hypothetical protein